MTKKKLKHEPLDKVVLIEEYMQRIAMLVINFQQNATPEELQSQLVLRKVFAGLGDRKIAANFFDIVQFNMWVVDALMSTAELDGETGEDLDCGEPECRRLRRASILAAVGHVASTMMLQGRRIEDGLTVAGVQH